MKKTVAIIFGGESSEYEVSCVSAANVAENLDKELYEAVLVGITKDGKWWIFGGSTDDLRNHVWQEKRALLTPAVISPCKAHHGLIKLDGANGNFEILRVDVVFPVLHGKNGEDGTMQGLLELAGIPYVGCNTYSSAVSMDKLYTKIVVDTLGIRQAAYVPVYSRDLKDMASVVKKIDEDILEYKTLNLILQPLIENAIDHGIDVKENGEGVITISGHKEGSNILLSVEDNGIGMDEEDAKMA